MEVIAAISAALSSLAPCVPCGKPPTPPPKPQQTVSFGASMNPPPKAETEEETRRAWKEWYAKNDFNRNRVSQSHSHRNKKKGRFALVMSNCCSKIETEESKQTPSFVFQPASESYFEPRPVRSTPFRTAPASLH